jgi:hypothetical protein
MFNLSLHVFTTILQGPSVILQELGNTIAGNMGRRSGSVINALRSMLFNLISMLFFFFSIGFVLWYVVLRPEWHALHILCIYINDAVAA